MQFMVHSMICMSGQPGFDFETKKSTNKNGVEMQEYFVSVIFLSKYSLSEKFGHEFGPTEVGNDDCF